MTKVFYDLETTGLDPKVNAIHQFAFIIEIDERVKLKWSCDMQPPESALTDEKAIKLSGKSMSDLLKASASSEVFKLFKTEIRKYIDPFDRTARAHLISFGNRSFHDKFLRVWFAQNNDDFIDNFFWSDTIDVSVLSAQFLMPRRPDMGKSSLTSTAKELGIVADATYNAASHVETIRKVYRIVTGLEVEL